MNPLNKWAERVYAETDFGRSIATSASASIGLALYLAFADWVIALFSAVIVFPIIRLIAGGLHSILTRRAKRLLEREKARDPYDRLCDAEKDVVLAFVEAGGCVLTWSHVNQLALSGPAIESLIQRQILRTSMTADGFRETFVLDSAIFDAGRARR